MVSPTVGFAGRGSVAASSPVASLFGPEGRVAFLSAYGLVTRHGLLRARVLALFLCATLATYADAQGMPDLYQEALRGLERTLA